METNEQAREQIFGIIENQMQENNPPEVKTTYDRLLKEGYDDFQTKQLIGQCLAIELFGALKHGKAFDENRYTKNLLALPKEPVE